MACSSGIVEMELKRPWCYLITESFCFIDWSTLPIGSVADRSKTFSDLLKLLVAKLQTREQVKQSDFAAFEAELALILNSMMRIVDSDHGKLGPGWDMTFSTIFPDILQFSHLKQVMAPTLFLLGFMTSGWMLLYSNTIRKIHSALTDQKKYRSLALEDMSLEVRVLMLHLCSNLICSGVVSRITEMIKEIGLEELLSRMLKCFCMAALEEESAQYLHLMRCLCDHANEEQLKTFFGIGRNDRYEQAPLKCLILSMKLKRDHEIPPLLHFLYFKMSLKQIYAFEAPVFWMKNLKVHDRIKGIVEDETIDIAEGERFLLKDYLSR